MQLLVHVFTLPKHYLKVYHFRMSYFCIVLEFHIVGIIQSSDVNHIFLNMYCMYIDLVFELKKLVKHMYLLKENKHFRLSLK